jgi:hypothetical protein
MYKNIFDEFWCGENCNSKFSEFHEIPLNLFVYNHIFEELEEQLLHGTNGFVKTLVNDLEDSQTYYYFKIFEFQVL